MVCRVRNRKIPLAKVNMANMIAIFIMCSKAAGIKPDDWCILLTTQSTPCFINITEYDLSQALKATKSNPDNSLTRYLKRYLLRYSSDFIYGVVKQE
jgi:hypothetical protein